MTRLLVSFQIRVAAFLVCLTVTAGKALTAATVAVAVSPTTPPQDQPLADVLLPLLELSLGERDGVQLVARQQAKTLIAELVRTRTLGGGEIETGKFDAADLLVSLQITAVDDGSDGQASPRHLLVRVTEGRTAVVRGVVAVPITEARVEDAAHEVADYIESLTRQESRGVPTIAVLPFESVDRFDRVRPLERGLRDLFASELLRRDACRVVQRTDMGQLLDELQLERAGLTIGGGEIDATLAKQSAYVLRGEVEQLDGKGKQLRIATELFDVSRKVVVGRGETTCRRDALLPTVHRVAGELLTKLSPDALRPTETAPATTVNDLYLVAMQDVHRFIRINPDDDGYHPGCLPRTRQRVKSRPRLDASTARGGYVLAKTVDRLESVLFLAPENLEAAVALAYCLSFHNEQVWRPEQCEKLLRRVLAESKDRRILKYAVHLIADMYFPHRGGLHQPYDVERVAPELIQLGFDRRLEMFVNAPATVRDSHWVRMIRMLERVCETTRDAKQCRQLFDAVSKILEADESLLPTKIRKQLVVTVGAMAYTLASGRGEKQMPEATKEACLALLRKWSRSNDAHVRFVAGRNLRYLREITANQYAEILEGVLDEDQDALEGGGWIKEKTILAGIYRKRGEAERAVNLLESFSPGDVDWRDFKYGRYGFELGQCYEAVGRTEDALKTYLHYAEKSYGIVYSSDILVRIEALGGVPLAPEREVDVEYFDQPNGKPIRATEVATDGEHAFYASGTNYVYREKRHYPFPNVYAYHPATRRWSDLGGPNGRVYCLDYAEGFLWAGASDGLWRYSPGERSWRQWTEEEGLPAPAVMSVAVRGATVYAGVSGLDEKQNPTTGGVVRIATDREQGSVHIYRDKQAPTVAAGWLALRGDKLFTNGHRGQMHQLDLKTDKWQRRKPRASRVASGPSGVWVSTGFREVALLDASSEENKKFQSAWFPRNRNRSGYGVSFMLEREGQLWLGGGFPWHRFGVSGLYRVDVATGEFHRFGPRDGFRCSKTRSSKSHACWDAVWIDDSLWLATSFGLAKVTPRSGRKTGLSAEERSL